MRYHAAHVSRRTAIRASDPDWIPVDASQRSLAYTNLPPGDYRLRVQGTNRAGRFSPHELRLPVTVLPAFHQTTWFRALMVLLLLALAYSGYRLRVRRLEARSETLERLVRERTAELETAYARIEEASLTDPLTQLRNRRFLEQGIATDLDLAARRHEDLVFLLLDLDHFKSVNDTYGHAAGDAVLIQTAAVLRSVFRPSDHVVRWGGEEFLVVARFVDRGDAPALAEKIRASIASHPFRLDDGTVLERTCSIGFAKLSERSWGRSSGERARDPALGGRECAAPVLTDEPRNLAEKAVRLIARVEKGERIRNVAASAL